MMIAGVTTFWLCRHTPTKPTWRKIKVVRTAISTLVDPRSHRWWYGTLRWWIDHLMDGKRQIHDVLSNIILFFTCAVSQAKAWSDDSFARRAILAPRWQKKWERHYYFGHSCLSGASSVPKRKPCNAHWPFTVVIVVVVVANKHRHGHPKRRQLQQEQRAVRRKPFLGNSSLVSSSSLRVSRYDETNPGREMQRVPFMTGIIKKNSNDRSLNEIALHYCIAFFENLDARQSKARF